MKFNVDNTGKEKTKLLLGDTPGIIENIHEWHHLQIANIRDTLIATNWKWDEISIEDSARQISKPENSEKVDLLIKTLSYQAAADTIASRSIYDILNPFVTSHELDTLLAYWNYNERVHALTYTEIIRVGFEDSEKILHEISHNTEVLKRTDYIASIFKDANYYSYVYPIYKNRHHKEFLDKLSRDFNTNITEITVDESDIKCKLLRYLVALSCMEGVSFRASFACTFALCDDITNIKGIDNDISLIARDEIIHAEADIRIINGLLNEDGWRDIFDKEISVYYEIINNFVKLEFEWVDYLLSGGVNVDKLTKQNLKNYVVWHMGTTVINGLFGFNAAVEFLKKHNVTYNPLKKLDEDHLNQNRIQNENQVIEGIQYLANSVIDDVPDDKIYGCY